MLPTPMKHVGSQGKKERERESSRLLSTPFSYATYQSIESQLIFFLAPRRCKAGAGSFLVSGETSSPGYFNNEWLFKQYNQNPYASPPQKKCMARKVIRKRKKKKRKLPDLSGQQLCHIQHSNKWESYNNNISTVFVVCFFFSLSLATEKEEKSPGPVNNKKKKLGKEKKKRNGSEKVFPCV